MRARRSCGLAVAATAALAACGDSEVDPDTHARRAAGDLATGIERAVLASEDLIEPFHCARFGESGVAELELGEIAGRKAVQTGHTVRLEPLERGDRELVIGVISDARGTRPSTTAAMGRFRAEFEKAGVELVVVLGGMARGNEGIERHLELLSDDQRWPVLMIPGDREELQALRGAVDQVGGGTGRVLDGTEVRFVEADGVVLATFPGAGHAARLVAGGLGCTHDADDANELANRLAERKGIRVWLTHPPPRLSGAGASDVAIGGVHVGESFQSPAIAASGAHVVIHGAVDEAAFGPASGNARLGSEPVVIGVGSADALPITDERGRTLRSIAAVIRIGARNVRWKRVLGQ